MNRLRRLLAVLLSVMVLLSSMPVGVWAEEGEAGHDHDHEAAAIAAEPAEEPTTKTIKETTAAPMKGLTRLNMTSMRSSRSPRRARLRKRRTRSPAR